MFNLAERFFRQRGKAVQPSQRKPVVAVLTATIQHIYTLLVVMVGWVFFRVPGLKNGYRYLLSMIGLHNDPAQCYLLPSYYLDRWAMFALILGVFMATPMPSMIVKAIGKKLPEPAANIIRDVALLAALFLCILQVASNTYSAFIYFQF